MPAENPIDPDGLDLAGAALGGAAAEPGRRTLRVRPKNRWTTRADFIAALRTRWLRGEFAAELVDDSAWEPIMIALRSPTASELSADYAAVQDWAAGWSRQRDGLRIEKVRVGGRLIGVNELPGRIWIDTPDSLWALLGVAEHVARYRKIAADMQGEGPELTSWVLAHPMKVLEHQANWTQLIGVVRWLRDVGRPGVYARQIDVPGVDTKFVEAQRSILAELLDACLPPDRVDTTHPRPEFAQRYRLATKPSSLRLRRLDGTGLYPQLPTAQEMTLRCADLARAPVPARTVFVVENEITYLAFPVVPDAVLICGGGYAVSLLSSIDWLGSREIVYWGDVDTHGFVMLDRLRGSFGGVRSVLMDRATFLDHEAHWGREPSQVNAPLSRLTAEEAGLYGDLIEATYGPALRLEQERIRFSALRRALAPWV